MGRSDFVGIFLTCGFGILAMVELGWTMDRDMEQNMTSHSHILGGLISFKAKAKPAVGESPLDPNAAIAHELDGLNQILGILGPASGALVQGLTGISIHDCAGQLKGKDMDTITCQEFIEELSECESLHNVKDLVVQAGKKKYKGKYNSKKPCFDDKNKKAKKRKP